jgi:hypothetical protein
MLRRGVMVLLACFAHLCFGQTSEIDQLLDETGLKQQIFQLPAAINEISAPIMRQTCPRCSAATISSTTTIFRQTFEPSAIYKDIRQRFEASYNSRYGLQVFHDMEYTVYGKMASLDTSQAALPAAKRGLLLRELAQVSGTSDVMTGLVCQIVRSVAPEAAGCPDFSGPSQMR